MLRQNRVTGEGVGKEIGNAVGFWEDDRKEAELKMKCRASEEHQE